MGGINIRSQKFLKFWVWKFNVIFQCFSFLRWSKILWSTSLHDLHPTHVGQCLNVDFVVNDARIFNSIDSLEYRCKFACILLFYRYYSGFCSSKIRGLIPVNHVFPCNTHLSWQAHSYVVYWPADRTLHDRQNSLSSRSIHMWNFPRAEVVIFCLLSNEKVIEYRKIITGVSK